MSIFTCRANNKFNDMYYGLVSTIGIDFIFVIYLTFSATLHKDLIHGAPIGKPVASRAKVNAVYEDDNGIETSFTRM